MNTYLRRIGFLLALASCLFCTITITDGVGRAYRSDLEIMVYLALLVSIYNCVAYFLFEIRPSENSSDKNQGIISLWIKRKKLEEEKRIKELSDSNDKTE
ncbi:hypothetical protein KC222_04135 [Cedecea davisae]|uniref:Lipoprotein n=1 Tax=Cedecea davisae TaxID=158484 RepID=A0ABS6DDH0_9ENTR|nr:hypothetical protein [Cedecea davisae]MBU4681200.1 hypothetical protein [Cedecea davisae]MBU4685067.1 hypothetical protein [Cedecea davisae]